MKPDDHLFENPSHLSRQDLEHYLSSVLQLDPANVFTRPLTTTFLAEVYTAYTRHTAYSTIDVLNTPLEKRTLPSIEDVRERGLKNRSGLCYQTNVFLSWVLIGLGFKVTYMLLRVFRFDYGKGGPPNHVGLVVRLDGEDYFLDAGAAIRHAPNLIPLNFLGSTPQYRSSIWEFKFLKSRSEDDESDRIFGAFRWTENSVFPHMSLPIIEEDFAVYLEAEVRYYTLEDIEPSMKRAHEDPVLAPVTKRLYMYNFADDRLKMMRNMKFFWEDEEGVKHEKQYETKEELVSAVLEHFGKFHNKDVVSDAIDQFLVYYAETKQAALEKVVQNL